MGDRDTALAALLFEMKGEIRADIRDCKSDLTERIADVRTDVADVRAKQGEHDLRLTALESNTGLGLTKKQKAALWTALGGLLLEGARHLVAGVSGLFAVVKGVPKL
jgi:hypothetical protein